MPVIPSPYAIYSHTTSGGNILRRAMRLLGVLATGENPSASEMADGMEAMNQMLDQWNSEMFTVPSLFRFEFPMIVGTQTYTIGPGTSVDIVAPIRLEDGQVFLKDLSIEMGLRSYTVEEWSAIPLKDTQGRPAGFYYEKINPFSRLNFWPIPNRDFTIVLWIETLLAQIWSPQAQFSLPQSYAKALAYNLAIEIAPEYARDITLAVAHGAEESLADLKRINTKVPTLATDSGTHPGDPQYVAGLFGIPYVGR